MKKLLLALTLFLFSISYSQEWKLISENDASSFYYKPNTDDTAWIKEFSKKIKYYPSKSSMDTKYIDGYQLSLYKYNCSSKKMGLLQVNIYSKDGKLLNSYETNEYLVDMKYVTPDSIGETFFNVFCSKEN